ncbi:MAG: hypothetical protein HYV59_00570 [Planctomycetes bacterium]|nr:hypothetical protein [Planctomycetota bacterium]
MEFFYIMDNKVATMKHKAREKSNALRGIVISFASMATPSPRNFLKNV